ncbi:MAG: ATP-dependent DNA helicase RecG [Actinomycetaceae bacterium]|nr:ATP-dependent DNA helicase RecG [Arcanobacterium sp.]MDD7505355.1 ATP-dependent DNA helicase RecG [Actinomycetaceae bacterium]MDY6143126.1 ATP-dependent DNA helicase RecG [Arcanobacterium sp.]
MPEQSALRSETSGIMDHPLERYIGKRSANKLAKLGLRTVSELIFHVPFRLAERGALMPIEAITEGEAVTVVAQVIASEIRQMHQRRGFILNVTIADGVNTLELTFFSKSSRPLNYHKSQLAVGSIAVFSGTVSRYRGKLQLTHPQYEALDSPDHVDAERITAPIPIYHAGATVASWNIAKAVSLVLPLLTPSDVPDPLPEAIRASRDLPARLDALRILHSPPDRHAWEEAQRYMAYSEAFLLQATNRYARRQSTLAPAPVIADPSPEWSQGDSAATGQASHSQASALASFARRLPFKLTAGQRDVFTEIYHDLGRTVPMRRLLQGDVGTGKTIVALLAMLQVIDSGHQAVLLAPTEVLAQQHYESIMNMLGELGHGGELGASGEAVRVRMLTGSLPEARKRVALAEVASGQAQLIIGTHALIQPGVHIPFLGLVVVDEQHRFGVEQRDHLATGAHLLVMTATPIPRTVAITIFGDLDVSSLKELPAGRAPITTTLVPAANERWMARVWSRAREEIDAGGRVYVVCPRIRRGSNDDEILDGEGADLASVEDTYEQLSQMPALHGIGIGVLHGQLPTEEKTTVMQAFAQGEVPLLIATTVIEVGVDVPEATMMVILDADRFGLSQLHQLRGRIGRGHKPSLCLAVHSAADGSLARERLDAFASTTDGFKLAQRDLELRSEGNVLGVEQSGKRSSLQFLRVLHDADIIDETKAWVDHIFASDPDLSEHQELLGQVLQMQRANAAQYLDKS